jgi:hypothetical protein
VLVGGTLLHTNRDAFIECATRGVAVRILYPARGSLWLKEYVQSAGLSLDDYLERIGTNAQLARRLVPGVSIRYHNNPIPAWFVLCDREVALTKPVAFFSDPPVEVTSEPIVVTRFSRQFERVWVHASEKESGPATLPNEQLQDLIELLNRFTEQMNDLREGIERAMRIADGDPEMALARSRKVLELLIRDIFQRRLGRPPGTRPLENLIQQLVKAGYFPARLEAYATTVRMLGNVGIHRFGEAVSSADVNQSLLQLLPILEWYFEAERPDGLAPG